MVKDQRQFENLPGNVAEYINLVIKNMRYRKKVRNEVREELIDHFEEYLKDCTTNEEKEKKAQQLISEFGDAKMLAKLMRRAKKRCRPLWQKILVRGFICSIIILTYLIICSTWLRMGSPTIKINYVQWLTDQQRQGRDESLNAMSEIRKATLLVSKISDSNDWKIVSLNIRLWPGDMNDEEKDALERLVSAGNETINTLKTAMEKPYFWTDYNTTGPLTIDFNSVLITNPEFLQNITRPLISYRQMGYILGARINWRAYSGDVNGAVDDLITLIKFSSHLYGQGVLVEQLVAMAIEAMACNRTTMILSRVDLPSSQLKRLQDKMADSYKTNDFPMNLTGEKAFWYDHIQLGFTDNGQGNGRILRTGTVYFVRDWKDSIWSFLTFSYPDRKQALALVENMFEQAQENLQNTPWQMKDRMPIEEPTARNPYSWTQILQPAYSRIWIFAWRCKVQREATIAILACLRYQKDKGMFPDNLEESVKAGYLIKVPEDPFGPGALSYKKTGDGFILYSWGSNLKDDNGEVVRNEIGKIRSFAETGDWVFWPIEKN